jgi:glucose-6-phosphate isomerase
MTIDLTQRAGLPVAVDAALGRLDLGPGVVAEETAVRDMAAARDVYADPRDDAPLYFMANGLLPAGDPDPDARLRYELTSLRPGAVGPEWVKTMGHVHAPVADGLSHPELYEVLTGDGAFPLFRPADGGWQCVLVDAGPGERFVIPPDWQHLAINTGSDAMVFADIVARAVVPDYTVTRGQGGAPVRVGYEGLGRNPRYGPEGTVVRLRATDLPSPVELSSEPLYEQFARDPDKFRFLLEPGVAADAWRAFDDAVGTAPQTPLEALPPVE